MTFELTAGAFTVCAAVLVFGLLSSAPFKAPNRSGKAVGALVVESSFAPAAAPSPSPAPAPGAPQLPDTSNANRADPTPTPSRTPIAHPTAKGSPTPRPVADQAPVVVLLVGKTGDPLTVIADASQSTDSDGTGIANLVFNFGDGSPAVTPYFGVFRVPHPYEKAGVYKVTVVATDTAGNSASASMTVTVG